jgi:sugar phosphate permease
MAIHNVQRQAFVICAIAAIFYSYEYFLRVTPSVISQDLMHSFNISNAGLGVLSAFFYYAYMPLQIPVGLLIDKFGTRIVLSVAGLLCVIGTFIFSLTTSLWLAQIGRFIIGFGSAFAFVGYLKICANWLPHRYYALMVGLCMLLGMFGAMGGEIILAKLIQSMTWREALEFAAWAGLLLSIFMWWIIRDEPSQYHLPHATSQPNQMPFTKVLRVALKNETIWLSGIIGCFTFLPLASFAEMWAMPYLETIGYSKTEAAFAASMMFLGFGVGGPLWGLISNWVKSRRLPLIVGSLLSAACAWLIIYDPYMHSNYMTTCLFGLGFFNSAEILVFAVGNDITKQYASGTTTALINMIVMVGGIILQPLIGIILDIISSSTVSQYQTALLVLPICLFIAAALSYVLKETYKE